MKAGLIKLLLLALAVTGGAVGWTILMNRGIEFDPDLIRTLLVGIGVVGVVGLGWLLFGRRKA